MYVEIFVFCYVRGRGGLKRKEKKYYMSAILYGLLALDGAKSGREGESMSGNG